MAVQGVLELMILQPQFPCARVTDEPHAQLKLICIIVICTHFILRVLGQHKNAILSVKKYLYAETHPHYCLIRHLIKKAWDGTLPGYIPSQFCVHKNPSGKWRGFLSSNTVRISGGHALEVGAPILRAKEGKSASLKIGSNNGVSSLSVRAII